MNQELMSLSKKQLQKLCIAFAEKLEMDWKAIAFEGTDPHDKKIQNRDKYSLHTLLDDEIREFHNIDTLETMRIRSAASIRGLYSTLVDRVLYVSKSKRMLSLSRERIKDKWGIFEISKGTGIQCHYNTPHELRSLYRIAEMQNCDFVKMRNGGLQIYKRFDDDLPMIKSSILDDARKKELRGYIICYPVRAFLCQGSKAYAIGYNGQEIAILKPIDPMLDPMEKMENDLETPKQEGAEHILPSNKEDMDRIFGPSMVHLSIKPRE